MEVEVLNRNRLVSKDKINKLELQDRVTIESRITDARASKIDIDHFSHLDLPNYVRSFAWRRYLFSHLGDLRGKQILDVCCGYSMTPVLMALAGADRVVANDVGALTLEQVRRVARMHGVEERMEFYCGPAEQTPFESKSFDIIYGGAAIHHLQIDEAGRELARLLRPGGRGGFQDPLGQNPLLEFARDNINYTDKNPEKGTDRPLKIADIHTFGRYFADYSWRGFDLTAMAARAPGPLEGMKRPLESVDRVLFDTLPFTQRYARFSVVLVSN